MRRKTAEKYSFMIIRKRFHLLFYVHLLPIDEFFERREQIFVADSFWKFTNDRFELALISIDE